MSAWQIALAAWLGASVPVALRLGPWLRRIDPGEDAPDGTAGDLLADQPAEIRVNDEFRRLVAPIEAERNRRLGGRVIWP